MKSLEFCCYNGEIVPVDSVHFTPANRSFRYGDGIFETIRCFGNQPALFDLHYNRLLRGMHALNLDIGCIPPLDVLERKIESLINKNRYFISSRVRLTVFRNEGGFYTPTTNSCSYLIEASSLDEGEYTLNEKGLIAGLYDEMSKNPGPLSSFKTANGLLFVMAGIFKANHNLGEVFIQNSQGRIIEALSSNLFWFKEEVLYTPSVRSGCVEGVMRHQLIDTARHIGLELIERDGVGFDELRQADEIFVTNAIHGINWIVGIGEVRFYNVRTRLLFRELINSILHV